MKKIKLNGFFIGYLLMSILLVVLIDLFFSLDLKASKLQRKLKYVEKEKRSILKQEIKLKKLKDIIETKNIKVYKREQAYDIIYRYIEDMKKNFISFNVITAPEVKDGFIKLLARIDHKYVDREKLLLLFKKINQDLPVVYPVSITQTLRPQGTQFLIDVSISLPFKKEKDEN